MEELIRIDCRDQLNSGTIHSLMRPSAPSLSDDRLWSNLEGMRRFAEAIMCEEILQPLASMSQQDLDQLAAPFALEHCECSAGALDFLALCELNAGFAAPASSTGDERRQSPGLGKGRGRPPLSPIRR